MLALLATFAQSTTRAQGLLTGDDIPAAAKQIKSHPNKNTLNCDEGFIDGRGWAVIEFNAAWGAGLNGCDAAKVLPAIVVASGPISDPSARN